MDNPAEVRRTSRGLILRRLCADIFFREAGPISTFLL